VVALQALQRTGGDLSATLEGLVYSPVMAWTPILGWVSEGTVAFLGGDLVSGLLYYGLLCALGLGFFVYVYTSDKEYYEDAMAVTETAYEKLRAAEEGQINQVASAGRTIKVARTGLGGLGARVLFYKHLRESARNNRTGLWTGYSLTLVAGAAAFALLNPGGSILVLLGIFMGLSVFAIALGRGMKELYSHYIYLIPEPPFSKMIWSNLEVVFKTFVEAVLAFSVAGVILGTALPLIAVAIAVHVLFCLVLLGWQYVLLRWLGTHLNQLLQVTVYILALVLILAPGIAGGIALGFWIGGTAGQLMGLMLFAAWELLVAFVCFTLSKGVLHDCDMQIMNTTYTK